MLWDVTRGACNMVSKVVDEGNELMALDFTADGSRLVTAGKNRYIRVHDVDLREIATLRGTMATQNDKTITAHTSRVTGIVAHPTEHNLVVTSSWDCTVKMWDLRVAGAPVRLFDGIFSSSGSPIDLSRDGKHLVAGNGSLIEFYDVGSGRQLYSTAGHGGLVGTTDGVSSSPIEVPMTFVQFSKDPGSSRILAAGGHFDAPCGLVLERPDLDSASASARCGDAGLTYGGLRVLQRTAVSSEPRKQLHRAFDTAYSSRTGAVTVAYGMTDGSVKIATSQRR